jgi:hypothetical protein
VRRPASQSKKAEEAFVAQGCANSLKQQLHGFMEGIAWINRRYVAFKVGAGINA